MDVQQKHGLRFAPTVLAAKKPFQQPFLFSDRVIAVSLCRLHPSAREQKSRSL